jgi:hypothetical protein
MCQQLFVPLVLCNLLLQICILYALGGVACQACYLLEQLLRAGNIRQSFPSEELERNCNVIKFYKPVCVAYCGDVGAVSEEERFCFRVSRLHCLTNVNKPAVSFAPQDVVFRQVRVNQFSLVVHVLHSLIDEAINLKYVSSAMKQFYLYNLVISNTQIRRVENRVLQFECWAVFVRNHLHNQNVFLQVDSLRAIDSCKQHKLSCEFNSLFKVLFNNLKL